MVHSIHKKECKTEKSNYKLTSIFPNLSKINERLFSRPNIDLFRYIFFKASVGSSQGLKCVTLPPSKIEKMKAARDRNKLCVAVLTDLTKAFDCLNHDFLIEKLHAFGFDYKFLRVMYAYLNNRFQLTDAKGSILGPLLFNVNVTEFSLI